MRHRSWVGAGSLLPILLVLLTVIHVNAGQTKERHYYIAAVEIDWNYNGNETDRTGPTYKKVVFREYEKGFKQAKTHPAWLGLLGPTLRAEEGETIVVTFRNMAATELYSIHPHGIAYGKQSEGADYFDNTSGEEKQDDIVRPGCEHVYYWEVTSDVSPQPKDPNCLTYTYISHQNFVADYNSGLIGALLICKPGSLDEEGEQIGFHREFVFLFGVFDEKESKYHAKGHAADRHIKYSINGYTDGSLPGVSVCAHAPVSLHLVGMSSDPELFSVHLNGQVLQQTGHKVSSVGLISGASTTATMTALHPGRWMLSSHTVKHMEAHMHGFVDVMKCEGFEPPRRRPTAKQRRLMKQWTYYIAAEEIEWDYAPQSQEGAPEDVKLTQSPTRIGGKYRKAVYTQYTNESFSERSESKQRKNELGILGPVIRAQIRDVITIVFKNMASRPYSIYPHGLTIEKSEEGVNYPPGGNHSHGVQPGETHTYVWEVAEEDEPLAGDYQCLTRMYHSAVDTPRDIASGLIGPMLICKSKTLNVKNVQMKADKEQHAMLAVFDENKSWYLEHNIREYCDPSKVNRADKDFYKSNVMHTINGYMFASGPKLGFCHGEVVTWHVSSMGAQDFIQTATFYGHTFMLNDRTEDFLALYPMTGETITMNMDNFGVWLMATLNSHETMKGMQLRFQDVECFRDYTYDYSAGPDVDFNVWKPASIDDIPTEPLVTPAPPKIEVETFKLAVGVSEPDYTDQFAAEWGLRSSKNSSSPDAEKLDLDFLNYDAVDVDRGSNITLNFTWTKSKSSIPTPNAPNETVISNSKEVDVLNITEVNMLNKSIGENTTQDQNSSTPSTFNDSSALETGNTRVFNSSDPLLENATTNSSDYVMSDTNNTTVDNATALSEVGNVSTGITNHTKTFQDIFEYILETGKRIVALSGDTKTSSGMNSTEDSKEKLTRGDVFFQNGDVTSSSKTEEKVNTTASHVNISADATNHSLSTRKLDIGAVVDTPTLTTFFNKTSGDDGSSEIETIQAANSSLEKVTQIGLKTQSLQNGTVNISGSNSSGDIGVERREVVITPFVDFKDSSESSSKEPVVSSNVSYTIISVKNNSSEELVSSESIEEEEVFIYLKENNTEGIKTTSVKTDDHYWTYNGIHEVEPIAIPEDMMKYFDKETPLQTTPTPKKKTKKITVRQRPEKGHGMKTKKRKDYKPQSRIISPFTPFSPRGFGPGMMTPRGARPRGPQPVSASNEDELINRPVVIGVPRPDFSNYELYIPGDEPDHLGLDEVEDVKADEYEYVSYKDPYSSNVDIKKLTQEDKKRYQLQHSGFNTRTYFIAAEEVQWDYTGYGISRQEKSQLNTRETKFTKVVFRGYTDSSFSIPDIRGEMEEHLGILGPVLKVEVGQSLLIVFKNNAKRSFSLHPNGVYYTKHAEGLNYEDGSKYWDRYDNEVLPNDTFTYIWKANAMVGPKPTESPCRTWVYYSGVNPEKDIHSGLIGPLLVCREGTLEQKNPPLDFMLLFMTFDESQSWYYESNYEMIQRRKRKRIMDPDLMENLKFHSINGIIHNLKGLRMYTNKLVFWHLFNMGSPRDFQSVHFHGQTFIHKKTNSYRHAVYPLLPGSFATLEMVPSKPGLWQLETQVGVSQRKGMQTLFLVIDDDCHRPLGLESGSVKDEQITAINTRGYWEPYLGRLKQQGKYNAWSTETNHSWIQVDFQQAVVISQVATQGAKQMFQPQFVTQYAISYSNDRRKWIYYKGDSSAFRKIFDGNQEAAVTKTNTFFPPLTARYIRLHPIHWYSKATVRLEFYGCQLDSCSEPLGMQNGLIEDRRITASSTGSSWIPSGVWKPSLARLNRQGPINAWQAKTNNMNQWLQVELPQVKKVTGIITQGASSLGKEMYVVSYTLEHSDDAVHWTQYTDSHDIPAKIFVGNVNNNDHVRNFIFPPIFARFIRIRPKAWMGSITMRIELLGCDFE